MRWEREKERVIGDGRGHRERTQICSNKRSTTAALLERVTIVCSCLGDWLLITREMGRGRRKGDGGGRGRRDADGKGNKKG